MLVGFWEYVIPNWTTVYGVYDYKSLLTFSEEKWEKGCGRFSNMTFLEKCKVSH